MKNLKDRPDWMSHVAVNITDDNIKHHTSKGPLTAYSGYFRNSLMTQQGSPCQPNVPNWNVHSFSLHYIWILHMAFFYIHAEEQRQLNPPVFLPIRLLKTCNLFFSNSYSYWFVSYQSTHCPFPSTTNTKISFPQSYSCRPAAHTPISRLTPAPSRVCTSSNNSNPCSSDVYGQSIWAIRASLLVKIWRRLW